MALIEETNIQSLSIEDLLQADVVSVSLFDKPINQVPAVVNIVPGADFKRYGWRTVADMLRTVPGFYMVIPPFYRGVRSRNTMRPWLAAVLVLIHPMPYLGGHGYKTTSIVLQSLSLPQAPPNSIERATRTEQSC